MRRRTDGGETEERRRRGGEALSLLCESSGSWRSKVGGQTSGHERARGMAVHQMVFFGAMVAGSLLWGKVANLWSVQAALIVSSLALVPLTVLAALIRLPGSSMPRA